MKRALNWSLVAVAFLLAISCVSACSSDTPAAANWAESVVIPASAGGPVKVSGAVVNDDEDAIVTLSGLERRQDRWGSHVVERCGSDGAWKPARLVGSADDEASALAPAVAINSTGAAVALWPTAKGVQTARRAACGEPWRASAPISPAGFFGLQLADDGVARALRLDGGSALTLSTHRQTAGRPWQLEGGALRLPREIYRDGLVTDLSREGAVAALWPEGHRGDFRVRASRRLAQSSSWEPLQTLLSATDYTPDVDLDIAVNAAGDALATWSVPGADETVRTTGSIALWPATAASWGSPDVLGGDATVALNGGGAAMAVWRAPLGDATYRADILVITRRPGGSWQEPVRLGRAGTGWQSEAASVSSGGRAQASWSVITGADTPEVTHVSRGSTTHSRWVTSGPLGGKTENAPIAAFSPNGSALLVADDWERGGIMAWSAGPMD